MLPLHQGGKCGYATRALHFAISGRHSQTADGIQGQKILDIEYYFDMVSLPPDTSSENALDEVDNIMTAWRALLPDEDLAPLSVFSRISRLARHLDQARREAFSGVQLEPWAFDVLSALRRAGEPFALTPGVLMQQFLVSSGTMTNRIDRLEQRGLVRRTRHPEDRRAILVELTEAGKTHADAAITALIGRERAWLGGISDREITVLADTLRTILLPFDKRAVQ